MRALFPGLLLGLSGCSGCGGPARPSEPAPAETPEVRAGAELYARYCALCHGDSGEGHVADNATRLNGQELLRTASDRFLTVAITEGRPGTAMSAYGRKHGGPLSDTDVRHLVALLRSWQKEPSISVDEIAVEGDPIPGQAVYAEHCASCHGRRAEGGKVAQSLDRGSFLSTVSDGFLRYAIEHGRAGTPMPGFGATLSEREIDDVVAYLRAHEPAPSAGAEDVKEQVSLDDLPLMRNPDGPRPSFTPRDGRYVPAAAVKEAVETGARLVLLDARPTSAWLRRRIVGALPVPYYEVDPILRRLPRDGTWIIAYCACPHAASGRVVDALREAGHENAAILDEGILHWIREGYPTESGPPGE